MAGAGYKLFNTGDVLTAAQVNTYLQEQVVMVFANAAARTSALSGVLAEGMVSYLKDTNATEVYDGSAWVGIGNSGDITGVTAGTGLTGGGASGSVTLSLDVPVSATNGGTAQTTYTTGDLLYASASNTLAKRAIGSTGQVLTVSGGVPTWATPAGGGKVLQVVQGTYATQVATTSSTYVTSNLTVSITPSSTSSKVLVMYTMNNRAERSGTYADYLLALYRNSTNVRDFGNHNFGDVPSFVYSINFDSGSYLDSPSTTSATSYTIYGKRTVGTLTMHDAGTSSIIAMEIGA